MGEIIADNLKRPGLEFGLGLGRQFQRRTIWIVDAHRGDGKRFVVRADEKLTAFVGLKSAIGTLGLGFLLLTRKSATFKCDHRVK